MITYQRHGIKREVEDDDKKRQAILERAGWKRVTDKATERAGKEAEDKPADKTTKEAEPLSMVEPVPQKEPVSLVEVDAYGTRTDEPAHHSMPQKLTQTTGKTNLPEDEGDDDGKKVTKRARPAK